MDSLQMSRYSRHILLSELGEVGQEKIMKAHVLVVGAGGLGSPALYYLASSGVGKITVVDDDVADLTNLQRQILHGTDRIGIPKALSAKQTLNWINPDVQIYPVMERLNEKSVDELVEAATIVLDCCDNFATRHLINRACVKFMRPLVSAAALHFSGQISVYDMRDANSPCYSCLYSSDLDFDDRKASQFGVFAPMTGILGTMQAAEAVKLAAGIGESLAGRLLLMDALKMEWSSFTLEKNPACVVCSL
ncbi:MAG: HesA/MoeB/ThiF family protein [Betaproteobacteria bacterium]|nr:HesA/MoeB/ThiF family protein [Betaproteobacteria bacterium]